MNDGIGCEGVVAKAMYQLVELRARVRGEVCRSEWRIVAEARYQYVALDRVC